MSDMPDQDRRAVNDRRVAADRRGGTKRRSFERRRERIPVDVDWRLDSRRSDGVRRAGHRRLITDRRGELGFAF